MVVGGLESLISSLVQQHPHVALAWLIVTTAPTALDAVERLFSKFVTFTHRMRLHRRRLRAEPDPLTVYN